MFFQKIRHVSSGSIRWISIRFDDQNSKVFSSGLCFIVKCFHRQLNLILSCSHVFMFLCFHVFMFSWFTCLHVLMISCSHDRMSSCFLFLIFNVFKSFQNVNNFFLFHFLSFLSYTICCSYFFMNIKFIENISPNQSYQWFIDQIFDILIIAWAALASYPVIYK